MRTCLYIFIVRFMIIGDFIIERRCVYALSIRFSIFMIDITMEKRYFIILWLVYF